MSLEVSLGGRVDVREQVGAGTNYVVVIHQHLLDAAPALLQLLVEDEALLLLLVCCNSAHTLRL